MPSSCRFFCFRYIRRRDDIAEENSGQHNEKLLFHGSPFINSIVQKGFDERHAYIGGMFGAGEAIRDLIPMNAIQYWAVGGVHSTPILDSKNQLSSCINPYWSSHYFSHYFFLCIVVRVKP